jgi:CheY-like chemotaxis protein
VEPFSILIIEDNSDDEYMVRRAFEKAQILNEVISVGDGEQALDYLKRRGEYKDAAHSLPGLILLDLNMPRMSGKEFLQEIENDDALKEIPVIVLTVSDSTEDILDCYDSGVYAYLRKPLSAENIVDFVQSERKFGMYLSAIPGAPTP